MPFTTQSDSNGFSTLNPTPTGEFLLWIFNNFHNAATLTSSFAKTGAANTFTQPNTFSGVVVGSGGFSGTTMGLSGALSGNSATFTGGGTFSGLLRGSGGISGTTR